MTALRRKYIPPMMECFQDILVISYYNYEESVDSQAILEKGQKYLTNIHQKAVDTFHPVTRVCPEIYF